MAAGAAGLARLPNRPPAAGAAVVPSDMVPAGVVAAAPNSGLEGAAVAVVVAVAGAEVVVVEPKRLSAAGLAAVVAVEPKRPPAAGAAVVVVVAGLEPKRLPAAVLLLLRLEKNG